MIAMRVFFTGNVQGVGFRYSTQEDFCDLPLSGFVRNLKDGRVELLIQGEASAVEAGLEKIRARWGSNIQSEELHEEKLGPLPPAFYVHK